MENSIFKDKIFWLLLLFASLYMLGNIGTGSLSTWDEAIYANVSREILQTGNWLLLHHRGNPWFDKPPFYMWCTALFYKLFGINEFTTRLTSGLFGIGTILLIYLFAKKIANTNTAILSALILLAMPHFLHFAKLGMMDVPLTFCTVLMIYLFWIGEEKPLYLFFSGVVLGLAYLIKGFAAFLGPIIILVYSVFTPLHQASKLGVTGFTNKFRQLFKIQFILGLLLSFAVIFLWHFIQYAETGPQALRDYFGFHILERATRAVQYHTGGINFYQKAIFNKNKPWSVLAYLSVCYILWQAVTNKDKRAILICCWIIAVYALYTLVRTKLHWYIVPIYPALALSSAIFLERFFKNKFFNYIIGLILLGMLLQVPLSWAFKLDSTPEVKEVAVYAKKLHALKNTGVYIIGQSYSEFFYCDFAQCLDNNSYASIKAKGKKNTYCIIMPEYVKDASLTYNFDYSYIYGSKRLSLYRIKFK